VTIDNILQEIRVLNSRLNAVLDEQGKRALQQAEKDILGQKSSRAKAWSLRIPHGQSLRFKKCGVTKGNHHALVPDVSCHISQPESGEPTGSHNVVIRVWSEDPKFYFRASHDAEELLDRIKEGAGRRVMTRYHFDFAEKGQDGPKFHLQVGGGQHVDENCWLPENLKVPRFCHYPMSLILSCQLILRTFFPSEYSIIAAEETWVGALRASQKAYFPTYFKYQSITLADAQLKSDFLNNWWNT
jgi:hypothetical protein